MKLSYTSSHLFWSCHLHLKVFRFSVLNISFSCDYVSFRQGAPMVAALFSWWTFHIFSFFATVFASKTFIYLNPNWPGCKHLPLRSTSCMTPWSKQLSLPQRAWQRPTQRVPFFGIQTGQKGPQFPMTSQRNGSMDWLKGKSEPETLDFPMKYGWVCCIFSLTQIHWTAHLGNVLPINNEI